MLGKVRGIKKTLFRMIRSLLPPDLNVVTEYSEQAEFNIELTTCCCSAEPSSQPDGC